jgi:2-hydroxymethylglutarate dehydrogenase
VDVAAGFIGIGRMGAPMARRLAGGGFAVTAYDVDPEARDRLAGSGAGWADQAAAAADGAAFVLCSLPTPQITEHVLVLGGVLDALAPGATVVDLGTGDPGTARRLAAAAAGRGVAFLDAPVSRGVAAAESGTLAMLVGGEADALEAARPLLATLATDIVHVGAVGAGQVTKLCNNMLAAINAAALGEVLVAGVKAGVALDPLTRAISASSGSSYVLDAYLPSGLFTTERPSKFALALMRKDIGLFLAAAGEGLVTLPVSAAVSQLFAAARAGGLDDADWTSVAEVYERLADVRLRLEGAEVGA